jgi:cysteine synthase A
VGASTDGASAIIGRYLRYRQSHTKHTVVDPENSVFFNACATLAVSAVVGP